MGSLLTRNIFRSSAVRWALVLLLVVGLRRVGMAQAAASQSQAPAPAQNAAGHNSADQKSDEPEANNGNVPRIKVGTNEVNVVFTVTDKHGKRITDLKQSDFRFVDDNKPVAELRSFHAETNLPLQVGLLIDASNSVRDRFKFEQESAIEFLNQTVRKGYDRGDGRGIRCDAGGDAGFHRRYGEVGARRPRCCGRAGARRCTTHCIMRAATSC